MKKRRISFFDLGILLMVLLVGLGAYFYIHRNEVVPPSSADELLADIRRNSNRYTDQEKMKETENYVIHYEVALPVQDTEKLEAIAVPGITLMDNFGGGTLGTLESLEHRTIDGEDRVVVTVQLYTVFTKTYVMSPGGCTIRVNKDLELLTEEGESLGNGTVLWISH